MFAHGFDDVFDVCERYKYAKSAEFHGFKASSSDLQENFQTTQKSIQDIFEKFCLTESSQSILSFVFRRDFEKNNIPWKFPMA